MDSELYLALIARWLHILAASLAVGVPIFVRFAVLPAVQPMDEEQRRLFRERVAARCRVIVYVSIAIFLATGFYNFLRPAAPWRQFSAELKFRYHLYFGLKVLAAFVVFFFSSALAGRSAKLAWIRAKAPLWMNVLIALGIFIVIISGTMRFMK